MKLRAITMLLLAEVAGMSLWFVSAAVLPEMTREAAISPLRQALLSSAVQGGFVIGALAFAASGLPDRFDPRRVFALSAVAAALASGLLLVLPLGGNAAIAARAATGLLLAGVYPVGMKIVVGWGVRDRGLLVGLVIGALTLGSASPHLISWLGGADWRFVVATASLVAAAGGLLVLAAELGPHHAQSPRFDPSAVVLAWTDRRIRLAYAGYLGHMWELFAMWAWIGTAVGVSYAHTLPPAQALPLAKLTAFAAIGIGAVTCVVAGLFADRYGKELSTIIAMVISGIAALLTAVTFGGPVWLTFLIVIVWGAAIIPDSAQFSALVADFSPPHQAGSLMTFQTALGFALTFATVQLTPSLAALVGWPLILAALAAGPAFGIVAMAKLAAIRAETATAQAKTLESQSTTSIR
jgi:MFS family permease